MIIRPATIKDIRAVILLHGKLTQNIRSHYDRTMSVKYPCSAIVKKKVQYALRSRNGFLMVATDKEKVIGFIRGEVYPAPPHRRPMLMAEVKTIFIQPKYRSQGMGSRFLKYFFIWAKQRGARRVEVGTDSNNIRAIQLYRKHGWRPYRVILESPIKKLH